MSEVKILHVVSSMNPDQGGVAQAIRSIVQVLSSGGYEHTVVCVDDPFSFSLISFSKAGGGFFLFLNSLYVAHPSIIILILLCV